MGSINGTLSTPFYFSSTAIVGATDLGFGNVAIAGRQYLIDLTRYQRQVLPATTSQFDEGSEVSERSLSREAFWSREQTDWSFGTGQDIFDGFRISNRSRFASSKGVDPWTVGQLCLLSDTTLAQAETIETNVGMLSVDGLFYWSHGMTLSFDADPASATPTDITFTQPITDFTTDGNRVYISFGGAQALRVVDVGDTVDTALGTETPDLIEFANGRLIGASGKELYELDSAGAKTTIRDDPRADWVWTAVAGVAGQAIFAAGHVGERGEFWATTVTDTGGLAAATFAGHLPHGEIPLSLLSYVQVMVIGTDRGLRAGLIANLAIDYGELIEVGPVRDLAVHGRFCWFTWTDIDGESTGLGRADLSVSVSGTTFVPAYASDLMATAQGNVTAVTVHSGDPYFMVIGDGIHGPDPAGTLVPQGTIDAGEIRYSVLPPKVFTSIDVHTEPLVGRVSGQVVRPDGTTQSLGTASQTGSVESSLMDAQSTGRSVNLRLTLHRDSVDPTTGPCLRAWVLHALPRPRRITEFIVPLVLKTLVVGLQGEEVGFDPLAEVCRLDSLASSAQMVTYQEGPITHLVRVDSVTILEAGVRSWQADRHDEGDGVWFEATVFVRLLSRENKGV